MTKTTQFDPATGGYTLPISEVDPKTNLLLDRIPARRGPTSTLSAWIGRSAAAWHSAIAYVRKDGANFIGWTDVAGQYREETRPLPDGRSAAGVRARYGRHSSLCPPLPADESGQLLADVQRPRDGRGKTPVPWLAGVWLLYAVEGGRAAGLERHHRCRRAGQLGRSTRLRERSGAIPTISPTPTAGCRTIARTCSGDGQCGRAAHRVRGSGESAVLHRQALGGHDDGGVAAGQPAHSARAPRLPRLSSQTLLDLRVSKTIRFGGAGRIELLVDVLNVLNETAEESLANDNLFGSTFGQGSLFVDPRRAMFGARLNFGR